MDRATQPNFQFNNISVNLERVSYQFSFSGDKKIPGEALKNTIFLKRRVAMMFIRPEQS